MKRPSNRWAAQGRGICRNYFIFCADSYTSKAEVLHTWGTVKKYWEPVYIPKYAYHPIADGALS